MTSLLLILALLIFSFFAFNRVIHLKNKQGGWFQQAGQTRKEHKIKTSARYTCSFCDSSDSITFRYSPTSTYDYNYRCEATIIKKNKCWKCETLLTIVRFKSGSVHAYDDQWEEEKKEASIPLDLAHEAYDTAENNLIEAETDLEDLEDELIAATDKALISEKINQIQQTIPSLKKKIKAAEKAMDREELKYEKLIDRYELKKDKFKFKL